MRCCVALGCNNRISNIKNGIAFHKFPKDKIRRLLWLKALRRENWEPSKHSTVCSVHFPEEMIDRTSQTTVRLRENAVPSIFEKSPKHSDKKLKMDESLAAGNAHVVRIVPAIPENDQESQQSDEFVYEESGISENEGSDISEDEDKNSEEESDPLTEERCNEKIPDTEFVTYLVCEANQQLPTSSQDYSVPLANNLHLNDRSEIKNIISNVVQLESQVQLEEHIKKTDLLSKLSALENKLEKLNERRRKDKKKIKTLLQSQRRNIKKITALNETIAKFKQEKYMAHKNSEILDEISPFLSEILKRQLSRNTEYISPTKYSVEAREFIKNLHAISPAAYKYVRSFFIKTLPHERTITRWKCETNNKLAFNDEENLGECNSSDCIDIQNFVDEENAERILSYIENGNVNEQK